MINQHEFWHTINNCSKYSISNLGIVINNRTKKQLKPSLNTPNGYKQVVLYDNTNCRVAFLVHRLVAMHFIENTLNKPFVNHIDGNKYNNNASNLEWCTNRENVNHAMKNSLTLSGEKSPASKLSEFEVLLICEIIKHKSIDDTHKLIGLHVSREAIVCVIYGKTWKRTTNRLSHIPYKGCMSKSDVLTICEMYNNGLNGCKIAKKNK